MAFTLEQKKDIRKYLCVPFGFYDLNTRLESMMDKVGADATDSAEVILWLTELTTLDAAIAASSATSTTEHGWLKKVDEVEFFGSTESGSTTSGTTAAGRGRALIQRIANALGVSDYLPYADYFTGAVNHGGALALG